MNSTQKLSSFEAQVYDRGIRLWGVGAQQKLRGSHVAIIGFGQCGAEITKNLVLAGVGSITLDDCLPNSAISSSPLAGPGHLFALPNEIRLSATTISRVRELNPFVTVNHEQLLLQHPAIISNTFSRFDLVCVCSANLTIVSKLNLECRTAGIPFVSIIGNGFGPFSMIFCDIPSNHQQQQQQQQQTVEQTKSEPVTKKSRGIDRPLSFDDSFGMNWKKLSQYRNCSPLLLIFSAIYKREKAGKTDIPLAKFIEEIISNEEIAIKSIPEALICEVEKSIGIELAYVSSVISGILSQEIIKELTSGTITSQPNQKQLKPLRNVLCYNSNDCTTTTTDLWK